MMQLKKILNPFIKGRADGYNCFGCSPCNETGLSLEFYSDGEKLYAEWEPIRSFEGYHNMIHGGIQATLMDEIASWTIYTLLDTAGVTQKMEVSYHRPLYINKGKVRLVSTIKERNEKNVIIYTEILNSDNIVCSSADVTYFIFTPIIAKRRYNYPGKDAFWN